jgi:hypothetical protein
MELPEGGWLPPAARGQTRSGQSRQSMTSRHAWWSIGTAVVVGIVGLRLLIDEVTVRGKVISATRSPDGSVYAILVDVPRDAHGAHSARVCLRRSLPRPYAQSVCADIAYISGVPASDNELGIHLQWTGSTELEIRYRDATSAYLYRPTFYWPNLGRRTFYRYYAQSLMPIHSKLINTNRAGIESTAK